MTPADQTAMTVEKRPGGWLVTVEQGNGDKIQTLELTSRERDFLGLMMSRGWPASVTFRDTER